jgi:hypothetical protein
MTTLIEVLDAARRLPIHEQKELFVELHDVLVKGGVSFEQDEDDDWLPKNFTEELTQAFFEAKRRALGCETP